ncbi:hypothetical protein C2E23DRAFT_737236 [Lenzites betulinus]|nr:hypothetical protein C2E23DRAFT_737236 [Lenzites betulinus]
MSSSPVPVPVAYKPLRELKTSPIKPHTLNNNDPRRQGEINLKPRATLDRPLQGQSSMGTTVLVDFNTFIEDLLPPVPTRQLALPPKRLQDAQRTLNTLFISDFDQKNKHRPLVPNEDPIAEAVVRVINAVGLPNGYEAKLSRYKADSSDRSRAKVDAALYPKGYGPLDDRPNWTHARFYIEFKKGLTEHDPWNDDDGDSPETDRASREKVRAQLIAYAHNTFLYQHRNWLYSLFIIGDHFRAARWDRSGVIVSRKVDYAQNTKAFLQLLWRFALLDDGQQGLDPTATLIHEEEVAFEVMDTLALPNPAGDVDHLASTEAPSSNAPNTEAADATAVNVPHDPSWSAVYLSDPPGPPSELPADSIAPTLDSGEGEEGRRTRSATKAETSQKRSDPDLETVEKIEGDSRVFTYVRDRFRESLAPGWPRYKLRVGEDKRVFLVGKPVFFSSSMFGRATRGYVAVDARTRRFVFLKDSWRPFYEGVEPEGTYLAMFENVEDMIVPALLCHGDVEKQQAYTAIYEGSPQRRARERERRAAQAQKQAAASDGALLRQDSMGRKKRSRENGDEDGPSEDEASGQALQTNPAETNAKLRHHIHYRIAVKDVCLPFDCFRSTKELIRLVFECIRTHAQAYEKFRILHRDISAGNVLILPRLSVDKKGNEIVIWHGVLTDWELAKAVCKEDDEKARQPERTGTWQFMSVASVAQQWEVPITVADELESFFHVMLFYAVRYLPHTITNVPNFIIDYFDTFKLDGAGDRYCSLEKRVAMRHATIEHTNGTLSFLKTTREPGNPLNQLIVTLLSVFKARYAVLAHEGKLGDLLLDAKYPSSASIKEDDVESGSDSESDSESELEPELNGIFKGHRSWLVVRPLLPATVEIPTLATRVTASLLDAHDEVLTYFTNTLRVKRKDWIHTEALGIDQLEGYEPRLVIIAASPAKGTTTGHGSSHRGTTRRSAKRRKTESGGPTRAVPLIRAGTDSVLTFKDRKGKGRRG